MCPLDLKKLRYAERISEVVMNIVIFFNDRPRAGQLRFEIEILPSGNRREFCGRHYARPRVPCPRRETVRAVRDALMAALTAREIIAK